MFSVSRKRPPLATRWVRVGSRLPSLPCTLCQGAESPVSAHCLSWLASLWPAKATSSVPRTCSPGPHSSVLLLASDCRVTSGVQVWGPGHVFQVWDRVRQARPCNTLLGLSSPKPGRPTLQISYEGKLGKSEPQLHQNSPEAARRALGGVSRPALTTVLVAVCLCFLHAAWVALAASLGTGHRPGSVATAAAAVSLGISRCPGSPHAHL